MGLDFGFVQCEIWSLDLGLLDFCFFCLEKGPGGLHWIRHVWSEKRGTWREGFFLQKKTYKKNRQ